MVDNMSYRSMPIDHLPDPAVDVDSEDLPTWRDEASCRGLDISIFFPDEGDAAGIARAKDVCASCPVQDMCAAYAVEQNQTEGIWGGTTRQERRKLRRLWLKELRQAG